MAHPNPTRMNVPTYQEVIGEGGAMFTVFVVELETGKFMDPSRPLLGSYGRGKGGLVAVKCEEILIWELIS